MADLDTQKIYNQATRMQELCKKIERATANLELLDASAGSIRLNACLSGMSCEVDNGQPVYIDLGPDHRVWVIQRLQQMVLDFENELKEVGQIV